MAFLSIDNRNLYYQRSGSGTVPVIFVHGFSCDSSDWALQVSHFEPHFDVIALDLNGHGRSSEAPDAFSMKGMASDVITLAEELGLDSVILVGHSMGSRVVLQALSLRPDLFKAGVLVDGSRSCTPETHDAVLAQTQAAVAAAGFKAVVTQMFQPMFINTQDESLKRRIIERAQNFPESLGRKAPVALYHWDAMKLEGVLQSIKVPLLVVQTNDDTPEGGRRSLSVGEHTIWLDFLSKNITQVVLDIIIIPDTSHFPMFDQPEELNRILKEFFQKNS